MTNQFKTSLTIGEKSRRNPQDGFSTFGNSTISKDEEVATSQEEVKSEAAAPAETEDNSLDLLAPQSLFDSYCLTLWANSFLTTPTSSFYEIEETEDPSVRMNLLISSSSSSQCRCGDRGGGRSDDEKFSPSSSSLATEVKNHHHDGHHRHRPSVGLPSGYPTLRRNTSYPPPDDFDDLEDGFLDRYSHVSITNNKCRSYLNDGHHHHSQEKPLLVSNELLHLEDNPLLYSVKTTTSHHCSAENDCFQQKRILDDTHHHHPHHNKRQRRSHYALGAKDFYDQILIKVFDDDTSNDNNVNVLATTTWS